MFRVLWFGIVLVISFSAASNKPVNYVVGGTDASITDAPWQAYVMADNRFCGGVVIDNNWILTAAHCVDYAEDDSPYSQIPLSLLSVYTGTNTIYSTDFEEHSSLIDAVYVHSDYNKVTLENDIALIKLFTPVNPNATPILMADANVQAAVDATANLENGDLLLTGWGATNKERSSFPYILQQTMLSTISDASCASVWGGTIENVPDYQNKFFCAKKAETGPCGGDSGGPLVWNDPSRVNDPDEGATLVGLVSFGISTSCASPDFPDVYTQVSNYQSWIRDCQENGCSDAQSEAFSQGGGGSLGWYCSVLVGWVLWRRRLRLLDS